MLITWIYITSEQLFGEMQFGPPILSKHHKFRSQNRLKRRNHSHSCGESELECERTKLQSMFILISMYYAIQTRYFYDILKDACISVLLSYHKIIIFMPCLKTFSGIAVRTRWFSLLATFFIAFWWNYINYTEGSGHCRGKKCCSLFHRIYIYFYLNITWNCACSPLANPHTPAVA